MKTRVVVLLSSLLFALAALFFTLLTAPSLSAQDRLPAPSFPAAAASLPPCDVHPAALLTSTVERYGEAVALSGDWLAVGAAAWGAPGAVVMYQRDPATGLWAQSATLLPPDSTSDKMRMAMFGEAVALKGDTLVVGAPGAEIVNFSQGAVYVYRLQAGAWQLSNLLVASSPGFYNYVGEAVAMDGDTIVASAPGIAAAYLFTLSPSGPFTQTETTKLVPQTGTAPNYAVRAVAVHGDVISLGSGQSGAAYLFERNQGGPNAWGQVAAWVQPGGDFGAAVALYGDLWAVGAPSANSLAGAVYLYRRQAAVPATWEHSATLDPPPNIAHFGETVVLDDGVLLAGGPDGGYWPGGALVFFRNYGAVDGWGTALRLLPGAISNPSSPRTGFGHAIAFDSGNIAVGAFDASTVATYPGAGSGLLFAAHAGASHHYQGERIRWTLQLYNAAALAEGATLVANLPVELTLAAPVELTPPQPGVRLAEAQEDLPVLASGLTLTPAAAITLSVVTQLAPNAPVGVPITATFAVSFATPSRIAPTVAVSITPLTNEVHLPLLAAPYPVYLAPGVYPANRCDDTTLTIRGKYVGQVYECVTTVEVRGDGMMQFNFSWRVDIKADVDQIVKYPDNGNHAMYITDNLSKRYDHIAVGGAAAEGASIEDNVPIYGWFLFTPAQRSANTFTFHDDDLGLLMENIVLKK